MFNLFKRLRRALLGEKLPRDLTETKITFSPTEVSGMYLINGTRTRVLTSPRHLAFRGKASTGDME